jgi:2-keto-3-deoxy-L-rhamnonate aldolase RhmA
MNGKKLAVALHHGQRVYGTLVTSTSPKAAEALQCAALDCVFIDTEHFPMSWSDLGWMCRTYSLMGLAPLVRIPRADPFEACRVLDMGASGVVAAYTESAEEVRALRGAAKLRPLKGRKLQEILSGKAKLKGEFADYVRRRNENNVLIVNIESVAAVEALDQILSVPGVDALLIGPHDLSCSLGVPEHYDHPLFEKTVAEIITKGRAKKVGVGVHNLPTLDQEIKWARAGLNLILHRADIILFRQALHHNLAALRKKLGDGVAKWKPDHLNI